jgi:hypothetical protein
MSNINELILDTKIHIASFDADSWYKLTLIDDEFKEYSQTKAGINMFIKLFYMWETHNEVKLNIINYYKEFTNDVKRGVLFGIPHSINDEPAEILTNMRAWCNSGRYHRENDLPAVIFTNGRKLWYKNGKCHREGDLPAYIYADGTQVWYKNDKPHRENDLPAAIYTDGRQQWYKYGKLIKESD